MRCKHRILAVLLFSILTSACHDTGNHTSGNILKYPEFITINYTGRDCIDATVMNPWKKEKVLHSYILYGKEQNDIIPTRVKSPVHIPLKRAVVMSNSHCRLLSELGIAHAIAGVCESEYISDPVILAGIQDGSIIDCGNSMYPNIEKIIELHPDAILLSPFEDSGYGQLEKLGIPLIECADYMETSPLGRAEWMRFYGLLFGVGEKADSLFESVSSSYISIKEKASGYSARPKVMLDTKGGSAWYMAGGRSTVGQLIADAGGEYILAEDNHPGAIPLSFESVYEKAADSDIWLLKNSIAKNLTYAALAQDFQSYTRFKPYQTHNIWVCNVYETPYFEITPFHPELLLQDFVSIFHTGNTDSVRFYLPMQE